ncbi:hypothetical protein D3C76_1499560 [compost metagenome]
MPQRSAQDAIVVKAVQHLIRPGTYDQAFTPMLDQCGQFTLINARQPSPIALWGFEQAVNALIVRAVEEEQERAGIGQARSRGFVVQAAILSVVTTVQQRLTCVALAFSVQNQTQGMTQAELVEHPLAGRSVCHDAAPVGKHRPL